LAASGKAEIARTHRAYDAALAAEARAHSDAKAD
jgi:hypothetical protein